MSFKVRHYRSRIYNPIKKKIFKALLAVFAAGLFFMLGWVLYEPLLKTVTEKNKQIIEESPVQVPDTPKKDEELILSFTEKEGTVMTVPEEKLYSSIDYYEFLNSLPKYITGVVLDLKTSEGTVTYQSSQKSVIDAGAVSENAVNMKSRIETARKMGFDVVARIYAFEDHTAPYNSPDLAIRYENEDGVLWLDNSFDEGGKPWMNPYSDTAQKYVMDIVYDAVDLGFDAVVLDGMRFPGETGQQYAYYGVSEETVTKGQVLSDFAQRIYTALSGSDLDVIVSYNSYEAINGGTIYGGSPATFTCDALSPSIKLSDYTGKKISDDFYYKTMPEDISEMCGKIYNLLVYATDVAVIPIINPESITNDQFDTFLKEMKLCSGSRIIIEYNENYFEKLPEAETMTDISETVNSYNYSPPASSSNQSKTETASSSQGLPEEESRNVSFG